MKKMYAIHSVEELRKHYSNNTQAHLKGWGYDFTGDRIGGEIVLTFDDDKTPDLRQLFLVTVEAVDVPDDEDARAKWLQERRDKDEANNSSVKVGRKFR